jgi:hypothetical protein
MNDDKMLEMRLRRMAERQGLLLEKARSLAARQVAQYHLIRGTEVLGVGGVKLAEIERQLMNQINATPTDSGRDVA